MDLLNETLDLIDKYENEKRRNLSVNSATTIVQKEDVKGVDISQRESTTESNITRINSNRSSSPPDFYSFTETESDYYSSTDSEEMFVEEVSEDDEGVLNNNLNNKDKTNKKDNSVSKNIPVLGKPHSNSTLSTPELLICESSEYSSSIDSFKEDTNQSFTFGNTNKVQSNTNSTIVENKFENKGLKGSLLFRSNNNEEIVKPDTNNSNLKRFDDFIIPKRGISLDENPVSKQMTHYYSKQKKSPIFKSSNNRVKGQVEEEENENIRHSISSSSFLSNSNDQNVGLISRSFTIGSPFSIGSPSSSFAISSPNVSFNGEIVSSIRPISSLYRSPDNKNLHKPSKKVENNVSRSLSPSSHTRSLSPSSHSRSDINTAKSSMENQGSTGRNILDNLFSKSPLVQPIKIGSFDKKNLRDSNNDNIMNTPELTFKKSTLSDKTKPNTQKISEEINDLFNFLGEIDEMENNKNIMEKKQNQEKSKQNQIESNINQNKSKSNHSRKNSQASIKDISRHRTIDDKENPFYPNGNKLLEQNGIKYQSRGSNQAIPKPLSYYNRDKHENSQEKFNAKLSSQIEVLPSYQRSPISGRAGSKISYRPEESIDISRNTTINTINTSSSDSDKSRVNSISPNTGHSSGQDELQMILNSSYVNSMKDRAIYQQQQQHFYQQQEMRIKMMQQQQQQFQNQMKYKLNGMMIPQQYKQMGNPNIKPSSSPSLRMNPDYMYSPIASIADLPTLNDLDNRSRIGSPVISPTSSYVSMDESVRSNMSNFKKAYVPLQREGSVDFISSSRSPSFEGIKDRRSRSPSFKHTPLNKANVIKVSNNSPFTRMTVGPHLMGSPVVTTKNIADDNSYGIAKQRYLNRSPTARSVISTNELDAMNGRATSVKGGFNVPSGNNPLLKEKSKVGVVNKRPVLKKSTSYGNNLGNYGVTDERIINSRKYI